MFSHKKSCHIYYVLPQANCCFSTLKKPRYTEECRIATKFCCNVVFGGPESDLSDIEGESAFEALPVDVLVDVLDDSDVYDVVEFQVISFSCIFRTIKLHTFQEHVFQHNIGPGGPIFLPWKFRGDHF